MEFGILERIVLQSVLPQQGDYVTFKIIKDLRTELSFSEKEIKDFQITQNGTRVVWDAKKEKRKMINIGEKARSIIVESFKKLDTEGKINEENVSLYEKFILTIKT